MDPNFDSEIASDVDWVVIEPVSKSPPLARPHVNQAPRIYSGYSLSLDGKPILKQSGTAFGSCPSSMPARSTGSALARLEYSSKSSGWEPPSSSSRAKPLARPPVSRTNAVSLDLPRDLPHQDSFFSKSRYFHFKIEEIACSSDAPAASSAETGNSAAVTISEDQFMFNCCSLDSKVFTCVWHLFRNHVRIGRQ